MNGAEFVNQLNNVNIVTNPDGSLSISKKVETPKTHIELVKDVPSHFMIPPTKETPPHFELIAFDDVVQTGFEIGPEEFEKKGNQVQLCAFISLLFLIAFFFNGLSSVFEFIIASIMSGEIEYRYILGTAYQFVLVALTTVIYVTYLHLFWQYDKNRFGSPYSMWLDIKCEPLRLLPIRRTRS